MAKSSPHNQNRYAHGSIVSREKCYFLKVFLILWKNEMESPIFLHDKYDLYDVCFHLNIYTATFLFDWWLLCWPEIWHWIFLPIQVSQYVLWDHMICKTNRGSVFWDAIITYQVETNSHAVCFTYVYICHHHRLHTLESISCTCHFWHTLCNICPCKSLWNGSRNMLFNAHI